MPIRCVARSKRAGRWTVRREAALARPPKPTSAALTERFQRAVGVEYFDAGARLRVDVEERLMACALSGVELAEKVHHDDIFGGFVYATIEWRLSTTKNHLGSFKKAIEVCLFNRRNVDEYVRAAAIGHDETVALPKGVSPSRRLAIAANHQLLR